MRRHRSEAGETLVELLITMMVIGTGVVAILGALTMAVQTSSMHRDEVEAQELLRSWAESLTTVQDGAGTHRYTACAGPGAIPLPADVPGGWSASVVSVAYWSGTSWSPTCGTDLGIQRVRLRVAPANTAGVPAFAQDLDVVLRRPCATATAC
jgi:type II secretory pathway pseudopilin PulG